MLPPGISTSLVLGFLLGLVSPAAAHLGFENDTEVRVYSDRLRVVVRTSIPFAWTVLGNQAPARADAAGRESATPLLIAAAPGLIALTAGGIPMVPTRTGCLFEVHEDVAFTLDFPAPVAWPVVVEAKYFDLFTTPQSGTITVFDHRTAPFSRDLEPLLRQPVSASQPSVSFNLGPPIAPLPAAPQPAPPPRADRRLSALAALLLAALVIGWLAARRLSR